MLLIKTEPFLFTWNITFDNLLTVHLIFEYPLILMEHYVGTRHPDESTIINTRRPLKSIASIWFKQKTRLFELQILKTCLHLQMS